MNSIVVILLTSVYTLEVVVTGDCNGVCCENYVFRDGKCTECPAGTHGYNCTMKCPLGYYGILCAEICDCSPFETCHPLRGCIDDPKYYKARYDKCKSGKENKTNNGCCVNQRKEGEQCTDCWTGYFGENCEKNCLQEQERFGRFCLEQCSCHQNETCHILQGCQGSQRTTKFTEYVFRDGKCTECPAGTHGYNCKVKCPLGYYGILCGEICNCSHFETCHPLRGCIDDPKYYKAIYDQCKSGKENKTNNGCCVNQRKEGEKCTDCWTGYFGENCEKNCLLEQEWFGHFCLERCSCNPNETCDVHRGCQGGNITTNPTTDSSARDQRTTEFMNWEPVLGLVIGVTFTAFIGINVIKRIRRQPKKQGDLNQTKVNDVHHFNTYKEYGISSETRSGVPKVNISDYPTLQREPETGIQIELEAYSTFNDFKTCSKV